MSRLSLVLRDTQALRRIAELTNARVGLENFGAGLSTQDSLAFLLDHARARDAVQAEVDEERLKGQVLRTGAAYVALQSRARDRPAYLRRPDLGRRLMDTSRRALETLGSGFDVVIVLADGLSPRALEKHGCVVLEGLLEHFAAAGRTVGPVVYVRNGRVAVGDDIGEVLRARLAIVLIGERPGLSSPESLGAYATFKPSIGTADAQRNCVSNIHERGMPPGDAAVAIAKLADAIWHHQVSGVALPKDDGEATKLPSQASPNTRGERPAGEGKE